MKSIFAAVAITLTIGALPAMAQQAAAPAEAVAPLSFNLGLTTDYRYRGISQTRVKPALQGGADYAFESGFYVGTWASTINWIKDSGGNGSVEIDLYGGYKTEVAKGLTLDVGVLQYYYPSNKLSPSADTFEVYGALSFGPVTAKYSQSTGNLFGFANSSSSGYFDLSATFDLGEGFSLVPHIGHQSVKNSSKFDYTDYSLAISKEYAGLSFTGAIIGADTNAYVGPSNKNLAKSGLVLTVKKTF
jgi:uncharacterized protein (TIGR02001 family)